MTKKLSLETKIRDAAISLTKVNASHKKVSKQSDEQLEAAKRRVDAAQKELWRVSERNNEVHKKLLEHRAGVLSFSVRSMENKMSPTIGTTDTEESGYSTPNRSTPMSPVSSSITSASTSSKSRFDGAHLFAGHADALVPLQRRSPSAGEITSLEEKLKAATEALTAANKKQAEMTRELSHLRLEKQEVETMMGMELQSAEETITALEKELPRLEDLDTQLQELLEERSLWERDRVQLEEQTKRVELLEQQLEQSEEGKGMTAGIEESLAEVRETSRREIERKETEVQQLKIQWELDKEAWEREKAEMEDEKMEDLARLQEEMDRLRREDKLTLQQTNAELDEGLVALRALVEKHDITIFSRDSSLKGILLSVGKHLEATSAKLDGHSRARDEWEGLRRKLEEDVRNGLDKREAMARDLEEARREREEARRETRSLETRVKVRSFAFLFTCIISYIPTRINPTASRTWERDHQRPLR